MDEIVTEIEGLAIEGAEQADQRMHLASNAIPVREQMSRSEDPSSFFAEGLAQDTDWLRQGRVARPCHHASPMQINFPVQLPWLRTICYPASDMAPLRRSLQAKGGGPRCQSQSLLAMRPPTVPFFDNDRHDSVIDNVRDQRPHSTGFRPKWAQTDFSEL